MQRVKLSKNGSTFNGWYKDDISKLLARIHVCNPMNPAFKDARYDKQGKFIVEGWTIQGVNRGVGNTTRFIDNCIQSLFTTGECRCIEIIPITYHNTSICDCTDKVLKRLKSEHPNVKIDVQGFIIKLNTFEKIYSE